MDWVEAVCDNVVQRLPKDERGGFNDHAMTAWQFGCMLLEACGYAEARPWGAAELSAPRMPDQLPIVEDVAVVVLAVAGQCNEISWRQMDGAPIQRRPIRSAGATWTIVAGEAPKVLPPNVAASGGFGSARISIDLHRVLELLGMVHDGTWTKQAHTVLLREQPSAWDMTVPEESIFQVAFQTCLQTIPRDVKEAIGAISRPATERWIEERIDEHLALHENWAAEARKRGHDPKKPEVDKLRRHLKEGWPRLQTHAVEQLFYARWRLSLGWDPAGAKLLPLFHDRLANQMAKAIIEELN